MPAPPAAPLDYAPLPHIDAKRAFEYTREVTAFGPRYMGNENHKKLERYILDHLWKTIRGDIEDDAFTADTVEGKFPVRNIIAKFPGTKDGIIVIMGHYDTIYPLRNIGYVGANDGGSSTAILLEFANQLRTPGKKRDGYSVWLVWTDGEEAVKDLDRHRQSLRHSSSRREMGERRNAEEDQSAYGNGHDRRC